MTCMLVYESSIEGIIIGIYPISCFQVLTIQDLFLAHQKLTPGSNGGFEVDDGSFRGSNEGAGIIGSVCIAQATLNFGNTFQSIRTWQVANGGWVARGRNCFTCTWVRYSFNMSGLTQRLLTYQIA